MSPDSIRRTYLPGIAGAFDQLREENRFRSCANSKEIKLLTKGFQRFYDKRNPKSGRIKTSFGMDLDLKSKRIMMSKAVGPVAITQANRLFTCMAVGIYFMLRRSEHIHSAGGTATPVHRRNLTFFDKQNQVIPYERIGKVKAEIVTLNVEFSKTDSSGFGRRVSHIRQDDEGVCIVSILEKYIATTRDQYGAKESDLLYKIRGVPDLTLPSLHEAMQSAVKALNIAAFVPATTSHSLRYGGATMMAAAGFPQYLIAHYGGWTEGSKSLRTYTKPSIQMLMSVSSHMARMARAGTSQQFINDACVRLKDMRV
jgi:hypothetical protein